ncbi:anti-sigma factor [Nocardia yunnanensis]|uniref:Anti-sigma factor n=1 Tax=Nocardia yunnanensis TaxID=2382165 RepID=A0A386ZJH6_9NOCA|nr:anti-sigma factor [Nocardia yunnanensis]AYF77701.1 anti-sigma factor [Nocardia yunnanensis]
MQGRSERESGANDWIPDFGLPRDAMAEMALGGPDMTLDDPSNASAPQDGALTVRVAARAEMLPMLRSVVETVLLTADFTLDVVSDMRVAIDEVATALVLAAGLGSEIVCDLHYDQRSVGVRMSGVTRTREVLREASLSRHLLDSLTDELVIEDAEGDDGLHAYQTVVHFARRRSGRAG